jgi:hypothetical protein
MPIIFARHSFTFDDGTTPNSIRSIESGNKYINKKENLHNHSDILSFFIKNKYM